MRIEKIIQGLRAGQYLTMENTFKQPPQDFASFQKQLGVWLGLGKCIEVIEEAIKDNDD